MLQDRNLLRFRRIMSPSYITKMIFGKKGPNNIGSSFRTLILDSFLRLLLLEKSVILFLDGRMIQILGGNGVIVWKL